MGRNLIDPISDPRKPSASPFIRLPCSAWLRRRQGGFGARRALHFLEMVGKLDQRARRADRRNAREHDWKVVMAALLGHQHKREKCIEVLFIDEENQQYEIIYQAAINVGLASKD